MTQYTEEKKVQTIHVGGIQEVIVNTIEDFYHITKAKVVVADGEIDEFSIRTIVFYMKFEIHHTIWTSTKPLTGKIFLYTFFVELIMVLGTRTLPTSSNISRWASVRLKHASLQGYVF